MQAAASLDPKLAANIACQIKELVFHSSKQQGSVLCYNWQNNAQTRDTHTMKNLSISFFEPLCALLIGMVLFSGCATEDTTFPDGSAAVQFTTVSGNTGSGSTPAKTGPEEIFRAANDSVVISGSNGMLVLNDVRVMVKQFEMAAQLGSCELSSSDEDPECALIENDLYQLDLPLDGGNVELFASDLRPTTYEELEFQVDNLDPDSNNDNDNDDEDRARRMEVLEQIQTDYPDFPRTASMVFHGYFTDTNGNRADFTTFALAELEVALEFETPVNIPEADQRSLLISIDPQAWVAQSDGSILNLASFNYSANNEVIDFNNRFRQGIMGIERVDP